MQFTDHPASAIGSLLLQLVSGRRGSQRCFIIWPCDPLDGGAGENCLASAPDCPRDLHDGPNISTVSCNLSNPSLLCQNGAKWSLPYLYPILLGRQASFDGDVAGLRTSSVTCQSPVPHLSRHDTDTPFQRSESQMALLTIISPSPGQDHDSLKIQTPCNRHIAPVPPLTRGSPL
jgi:hypothetical protein